MTPAVDAVAPHAFTSHAFTVDVEDWFQVQAYAGVIARAEWERLPSRVEANTDRLLALCHAAGVRGTFFVLGWVAERHPALVRRIVAAGHELASHGHGHGRVDAADAAAFRADVLRAKGVLEDVGGIAVRGYRAPTFSIGSVRTPWAWEVLAETGHAYSSSVYPVRHDLYGEPDAPRAVHRRGAVWEVPMTTLRLRGRNVPVSGGGWFRLLPYPVFRAMLGAAGREGSGLFYTHPWEIDPGQPRVAAAPARSRLRHRIGLSRTEWRLARLLRDFRWDRMDRVFPELAA